MNEPPLVIREASLPLSALDDKVGLVLSGGGARGAFQVGVWEVLRHHPHGLGGPPWVISGTSAGSLNGALIAAGLSPAEMLDFWLDLARRPPVKANPAFFSSLERALLRLVAREPLRSLNKRRRSAGILVEVLKKHVLGVGGRVGAGLLEYILTARFDNVSRLLDEIATSHLFTTEPMRARLADAIGGWTLARPVCRLAINTVDLRSGQVVRFVSHAPHVHSEMDEAAFHAGPITVEMILASASIPILFDPVRIGPHELWDGGLLVNTPIAPAIALGADRVVPVLVTAGARPDRDAPLSLGDAIERLADAFLENAYNTDRKLLLERNRLAAVAPERGLRVAHLYEAIRPASQRLFNAGSYLYFEPQAMLRMYEAGRTAAQRWLAQGPRLDIHPGQEHVPKPAGSGFQADPEAGGADSGPAGAPGGERVPSGPAPI